MAGRMVLVKSCLNNIPNYWFSLHQIPKSVIKDLDKVRRNFFWGYLKEQDNITRKMHILKWDKVCVSKQERGLNLSQLSERNLALLAKWWWKFHADKNKRWMRFLINNYGIDFIYRVEYDSRKMSFMLIDIWRCCHDDKGKKLISPNMFFWKVGDGQAAKFWKDQWYGSCPLSVAFQRLYNLSVNKDISIAEMLILWKDRVDSIWRRKLRGWEYGSAATLGSIIQSLSTSNQKDLLIWQGNKNVWRTRNFYHLLVNKNRSAGPWMIIWQIKVPHRIKNFLWKVGHNILPVRSFIASRIRDIDVSCPLCKSEIESSFHLFWECSIVQNIWKKIWTWWNVQIPPTLDKSAFLKSLLLCPSEVPNRTAQLIVSAVALWNIWKSRNLVIFQSQSAIGKQLFI